MPKGTASHGNLLDAGVKVSAVVDLRADSVDAVDHAAAATIPIHRGEAIAEALPDKDGTRVAGVRVVPLNSAGQLSSTGAKQIVCDGGCGQRWLDAVCRRSLSSRRQVRI